MRADLAAELLHFFPLNQGLHFQSPGLVAVQVPLHGVLFVEQLHLVFHGVLHFVEGARQTANLILPGNHHIRHVKVAAGNFLAGLRHLLNRPQNLADQQHQRDAKGNGNDHHQKLQFLQSVLNPNGLNKRLLVFRNGQFQQLLGVLQQIASAGLGPAVIFRQRTVAVLVAQILFQLIHAPGKGGMRGMNRAGQQMLLLPHQREIRFDVVQIQFCVPLLPVQLSQQAVRIAIVPAKLRQAFQAGFHAGQKPADRIDVVGLALQRFQDKEVLAVVAAQQQCQRQAESRQHQKNTPHDRDMHKSFHRAASLPQIRIGFY